MTIRYLSLVTKKYLMSGPQVDKNSFPVARVRHCRILSHLNSLDSNNTQTVKQRKPTDRVKILSYLLHMWLKNNASCHYFQRKTILFIKCDFDFATISRNVIFFKVAHDTFVLRKNTKKIYCQIIPLGSYYNLKM